MATDEKSNLLAEAEFSRDAARISFDGTLLQQYTILLNKRRPCQENVQ